VSVHNVAFIDTELRTRIEAKVKKGTITCSEALLIAEELGIPKRNVGMALDGMNIKIKKCQLGCFE